jgi:predicted transcriptional regulator
VKILIDTKINDYYILKIIHNNHSSTMRQMSYELGVSLGSIHSKVESLVYRKFLINIDLSNGSRKKRYQYQITNSGFLYLFELCQDIRSCISKELDYINTYEFEKIKHEYGPHLSKQNHQVNEKSSLA